MIGDNICCVRIGVGVDRCSKLYSIKEPFHSIIENYNAATVRADFNSYNCRIILRRPFLARKENIFHLILYYAAGVAFKIVNVILIIFLST